MTEALKSCAKTTLACMVPVIAGAAAAAMAPRMLPGMAGKLLATVAVIVALAGSVLTLSCLVVLWRLRRQAAGEPDLFLSLNESRSPPSLEAARVPRRSRLRRWLARRLLGHELIAGDLVEVRSWQESCATLYEQGCLEDLPFMPEMLALCGKRARVFRGMHRLFDYRKSRLMRHMDGAVLLARSVCDGAAHGGCEAACHAIWKAAWLRRVDPRRDRPDTDPQAQEPCQAEGTAKLLSGTRPPRYACQLTQLHDASTPIGWSGWLDSLRPLVSGNVAPAAFAVGWLTHLFNQLQHLRGGIGFPAFAAPTAPRDPAGDETFRPGEQATVRPSAAIRATLDNRLIHRGLGFELDMLKHCGVQYPVEAQVTRLIDIVTGEMRHMKTPAYLLRGVHFSGERQLFNAQYEPLFWRAAWLRRAEACPGERKPKELPSIAQDLKSGRTTSAS